MNGAVLRTGHPGRNRTGVSVAGLDGSAVGLARARLGQLEGTITGRLLLPGDEGWGAAVLVGNGLVAKVPALVVQPVSAAQRPAVLHNAAGQPQPARRR